VLRKTLQNLLSTGDDDDDNCDDSDDEWENGCQGHVECYTVQQSHGRSDRHQPWIKYIGRAQHHDAESTSTTWMATLLHTLHFRLVDHSDIPPSHLQRPTPRCPVYVLDSDPQPDISTSGFSFKHETGSDRLSSVVSQSKNAVASTTLRSLPDMPSSSSSSLRTVSSNCWRPDLRLKFDVTSARSAPPPILPKPNYLQSPPLAARYPLRRKTQAARSKSEAMTSSTSRDVVKPTTPLITVGPPPPPLPARRTKLPPIPSFREHLEPPSTQPTSGPPVKPATSAASQQTSHDESSHILSSTTGVDDDDVLSYKVDVCGTSMLHYVLQVADSLSASDDLNDIIALQQQKQFVDDGNNVDKDDCEPPVTGDVNSFAVSESSSKSKVI